MFGSAKNMAGKAGTAAAAGASKAATATKAVALQGAKRASQASKATMASISQLKASYSAMSVYRKTAFINSFTQIAGIIACTMVVLFPKTSGQLTGMDELGHAFADGSTNLNCQIQKPRPDGTTGTLLPDFIYKKQQKILNFSGPGTMITLLISLLFTNLWMMTGADANTTGKVIQFVQILLAGLGIGFTSHGIHIIYTMKTKDNVSEKCFLHFRRHLRLFIGILFIFILQFGIGVYMMKQLSSSALTAASSTPSAPVQTPAATA